VAYPISFNIATGVGKAGSLPSLIVFGTDGLMTGVIVKSARFTPMIEEIKVEQGSGLTANDIILNDGTEAEITVDDDRAITWPLSGGTFTLYNPQPNGSVTTQLFQCINNNYSVSAKQLGERTIIGKAYILIAPVQM